MNYQLILGRIKDRDITLEEITRMDLDSKTKAILLYAYYEVNKMSYELKRLLNQAFWSENEEMLRVKKRLIERSKQNSKFFDIGFFKNLIMGKVRNQNEAGKVVVGDKTFLGGQAQFQKYVKCLANQSLEDALELCEKSPYANNKSVMAQRISVLKAMERYEDAAILSDQYKAFYGRDVGIHCNAPVQDHKSKAISVDDVIKEIARLRDADKFEEALDLCENGPYADNTNVLVQRVGLLKELGRLEEALDICEQPNLSYKPAFIELRVAVLKQLERYEEAFALCEMPGWQNNMTIMMQRVYILIALDRLDEALDITQKSQYEDVRRFGRVVVKIITSKMEIEEAIAEVENTTNSLDYERWITLVGKVNFLISRHMQTSSLIGYLEFLLQVNVQSETKQIVSYVSEVTRLREIRDDLGNRLRKSASGELDSSEGSKHKLNLAFRNDLC